MTLSSKQANHLVDYAKKNKRFVFCVMQNRFSPTIMWLKKIIEQKKLGRIFSIHVNCFWNRNEKYYKLSDWHGKLELDGGPLYTQFSHFIDILYWLFGEIKNIVKAEFINFRKSELIDFEDSGFLNFDFSSGAKGTLNYSTSIWEKNFESSIIVNAEKGTLKIGGQYMDKLDYCHIENYEKPIINNSDLKCNDYGTYKGSAANHDRVIENIVNVIYYDLNVYKTKSIRKYSLKKNLDQINWIKGLKIPIFIGGGINQNNVSKIINSVRPDGLDISRSLKNSKNILSSKKLNSFLSQISVA